MKIVVLVFLLKLVSAQDTPNFPYGTYDEKKPRNHVAEYLFGGAKVPSLRNETPEYPGFDGWYNNLDQPSSGAIDGHLLRRAPAAYEDSTYSPAGSDRPNPIELSDKLLAGAVGTRSRTGKTALLVFFGQQVVEEILDAQRPACPPEYFNIEIPENHTYRSLHTVMPLLRTRYDQRTGYSPNNPRQQLNEITPYLDGGLMYGITKQWADQLRTYSNGSVDPDGCLASSHDGLFPEYNTQRLPLANPPPPFHHSTWVKQHETAPVSRFFKLGNPRGNENTFLLTFGILWFRWHNYIAKNIRNKRKDWTSERVFNEARKWVIATQQHIVVDEWLPSWLSGPLPPYPGYDPSINPQIDQLFQTAAFRFGHTLVTPGVYLRDYGRNNCSTKFNNWKNFAVRTCNAFWRPQDAIKTKDNNEGLIDIDRLLMGMAYQMCEEEDHKIVEDLRGNVFGPLEFPRRDLMAVNIQRGRDHGVPDFNSARKAFNLEPYTSFENFTYVEDEIKRELRKLYNGNLDNIDIWVGGILETGDGPGELFETIIRDQFSRIRNGDRFWYENTKNGLFTDDEIKRIKKLTLYDIIMCTTKMDHNDIQKNVFRAPTSMSEIPASCRASLIPSNCSNMTEPKPFDCYHLPQLNKENLNEECTQATVRYDYFSNSQISFIITFVGLGLIIIALFLFVFCTHRKVERARLLEELAGTDKPTQKPHTNQVESIYVASEWVEKNTQRPVVLKLDTPTKQLQVMSGKGKILRTLNFSNPQQTSIYTVNKENYLFVKPKNDYDLILRFENNMVQDNFQTALRAFFNTCGVQFEESPYVSLKVGLNVAETYAKRKEKLNMFFRVVFAQAFGIEYPKDELLQVDTKFGDVTFVELTLYEFADALSMRPETEFVQRMFNLIDKDKSMSISFREFADLLVIFANGNERDKAKLLFDMYDINAVQYLTKTSFENMIKSFLETVGGSVQQTDLDRTIHAMLTSAGLERKEKLTFDDFLKIVGNDIQKLNKATLGFKGVDEKTRLDDARKTIENLYESPAEIAARINKTNTAVTSAVDNDIENYLKDVKTYKPNFISAAVSYVEHNVIYLFWVTLYTLVLLGIFAERAYHYSVESEHSGLRRIAGYGVTITRGAASAQMFTYASLLVTMSRNTFSIVRETAFGQYFPLDTMVDMHKYIAVCALISTVLHIIGHSFNFYHISTQTSDDLTCLFRNYFHATHEIPKFHYWAWHTITGFTGMVLVILMAAIYTFSLRFVRRKLYNMFWYVHSLYPIFFIFMILHGAGRLIQEPFFHYFFLPCLVIFVIDKLISVRRKKVQIPVLRAEILPSNVTMLEFTKPLSFEYKAGQYVNIACLGLNPGEFHPFTLSSSPDEQNLTVHIRTVGPWTEKIRRLYDEALASKPLPQIYLDGPYGEGHQDWYNHEVSILMGAGIGVTPFASILKDIVSKANVNYKFRCKQVYFFWVAKTQKQFEWMVDIIRNVEQNDKSGIVSAHIFVTQFYEKFDLRTILLYICERHYQKLSNKSLFTNLKAVTHFGRPHFPKLFKTIQSIHPSVNQIGVFSCGSPPVISAVESACFALNKQTRAGPRFIHVYKGF